MGAFLCTYTEITDFCLYSIQKISNLLILKQRKQNGTTSSHPRYHAYKIYTTDNLLNYVVDPNSQIV